MTATAASGSIAEQWWGADCVRREADQFLVELLGEEIDAIPPRAGSRLYALRDWVADRISAGRAEDDIHAELIVLLREQLQRSSGAPPA